MKFDIPEGHEVEMAVWERASQSFTLGAVAQTSAGAGSVDVIAKGMNVGKTINQEECENM